MDWVRKELSGIGKKEWLRSEWVLVAYHEMGSVSFAKSMIGVILVILF